MKPGFSIFLAVFLSTSLLSAAVPISGYGGSATVVAGLVSRARVLPVGGGSADEVAADSIVSTFKASGLDRFMELCGDTTRLRARIKARVDVLNSQLCNGAKSILDDCVYTNSICDGLKQRGCEESTSASGMLSGCIERANGQGGETLSSLPTLEAAVSGRCQQACSDGISVNGAVLSQSGRDKCSASGFICRTVAGVSTCSLASEAGANGPITIQAPGNDSSQVPSIQIPSDAATAAGENASTVMDIGGIGLNATIAGNGDLGLNSSEAAGANASSSGSPTGAVGGSNASTGCPPIGPSSCPSGQTLRGSIVNGCKLNQCVSVVSAPIPDSCTDSDGGVNVLIAAKATSTISGVATTHQDACVVSASGPSNSVTEWYCDGTALKSTVATCPTGQTCSNGACTGTAAPAPAPSTTNYTCTDTDAGVKPSLRGTASVTPSIGSPVSSVDACTDSTHVREYSCSSPTAATATSAIITCATGQTCTNGACTTAAVPAPSTCATTCSPACLTGSTCTAGAVGSNGCVSYSCIASKAAPTCPTTCSSICGTGYSCTAGAVGTNGCPTYSCTAAPAPLTGKFIAPFTVEIIAVPSVLSAFAVSPNLPDDAATAAPADTDSCVANCKGAVNAEVCGSFSAEHITEECRREVAANAGLIKKFCTRGDADAAFNECTQYVESTCGLAQPAFEKCNAMLQDTDAVVDLLLKSVESKCEASRRGLDEGANFDWAAQLPPSSSVIADGTAEQVVQSKVQIQKSLNNNFIDEAQRLACLRYAAEKQQAKKCKDAVESIQQSVQRIQQLREQLDDAGKQSVDRSLEALNVGLLENQRACEAKEKNAGGLCSSILGG